MNQRLTDLTKRGVPLVEVVCTLMPGVSAEVACEAINRIHSGVAAYPYGSPNESWGKYVVIQIDPNVSMEIRMMLTRVPIDASAPGSGFLWECESFGVLEEMEGFLITDLHLSQPGNFDNAEPWTPCVS